MQRWTIEQRGFWVHGVRTLPDYIRVATEFTLAGRVDRIDCPTLLCAAQDDPLSGTAAALYDGLTAPGNGPVSQDAGPRDTFAPQRSSDRGGRRIHRPYAVLGFRIERPTGFPRREH